MTLSPRPLKRSRFITKIKNIFTRITYLNILTISYNDVKLTSATALREEKLNSLPHYDYVIGLAN